MSGTAPPERAEMICDDCEVRTEWSPVTDRTGRYGHTMQECHDCGHVQDPIDEHEGDPDWGYPD